MPPCAILVNGISATGKTTIGRQIAIALNLPFFAKDAVKERLFDTVGTGDRAWAHRLSGATHAVLNYVLEEELRCGRSFVLEANFNPQFDVPKMERWQREFGLRVGQVLCYADGEVVFERFRQRVLRGERHPGHCDGDNVEAFRGYLMQGKCAPLEVSGPVFEVDTTDNAHVDVPKLVGELREWVDNPIGVDRRQK